MNSKLQEFIAENPAFYLRVSTEKKEQEKSIKYQKEYFTRICNERGYGEPRFYYDKRTGTSANRKGYKELIEDIKAGKIDLLMAKELGRLARNQKLAHELKALIQSNNVHMITEDGAINTITGDKDKFGLYAWIYEQEAKSTSRRIKMTLETRAKKGLFNGSVAPYGYRQENGKLFVRDDESPQTVKDIYKWYIEGEGFDAIAHKLYARGILTPSQLANKRNQSSIWHGSSVRLILEDPMYAGDMVQGRSKTDGEITQKKRRYTDEKEYHIVKDTHEAIISKADFDTVQSIIKDRRKDIDGETCKLHKNVHLFTHMIRCKDCNRGFHFKRNRKGYICAGYNKHGAAVCSDHLVHEQFLIDTILSDLQKLADTIDDADKFAAIKQKSGTERSAIKREMSSLDKKIDKINAFKKNALEMLINKEISQPDFRFITDEKDKELEELIQRKDSIEKRLSETIDDNLFNQLKEEVDKRLSFKELTRETLNRYVSRIEIGEDRTVDIYYKYRGSDTVMNLLMG